MDKYTAVIIGGGPSGYSCAVRISQMGGKVALVEKDFVGGICVNWGCTPSKSMIESAKVARMIREAAKYGIDVPSFEVNFKQVAERRDEVILSARATISDLLTHYQVDIFQGEAEILTPTKIKVHGGKLDNDGFSMHYDGNDVELETENIVLATGSAPLIPVFVQPNDPSVVAAIG